MIQFIRTETESSRTLTVVVAGRPMVLSGEHPNFDRIADLLSGLPGVPAQDLPAVEADLLALIHFAEPAVEALRQLSEWVGYRGGSLFFDGDPVDNRLSAHIVRMIKAGDNKWIGPVRFMENLAGNPAAHVRHRLYSWISDRGMTITEDGLLIGYKGVHADPRNTSITAGRNTVWVDGVPHAGHIPNPVGATVTMARAEVDSERDAPCSHGLHVGTFDYARDWAGTSGRVLLVAFNPRDVVAIPKDCDYAKIRTCRYTVIREATGQVRDTTWPPHADIDTDEHEDEEDDDDRDRAGQTCADAA